VFTCRLAQGDYFISLGIASKRGEEVIPHDRRYDSIHLQVRPHTTFFGLTDLNLTMNARETAA
jgi:lipopolysaccharide transport system ATP-binding protein